MKNLANCRSLIKVGIIGVVLTFMASQITEVYAAKAFVGKTGQTFKRLDGDDGDLQAGVAWQNPRFKDNGDGTVTDKLTNLIWDKDADRHGTRTWAAALDACNQLADNGGDLTDGSQAGDWHLVNRFELESILHLGVFDPAVPNTLGTGQWGQGDAFIDVRSARYWSSTEYAGDPINKAWRVKLTGGALSSGQKTQTHWVWCAREAGNR